MCKNFIFFILSFYLINAEYANSKEQTTAEQWVSEFIINLGMRNNNNCEREIYILRNQHVLSTPTESERLVLEAVQAICEMLRVEVNQDRNQSTLTREQFLLRLEEQARQTSRSGVSSSSRSIGVIQGTSPGSRISLADTGIPTERDQNETQDAETNRRADRGWPTDENQPPKPDSSERTVERLRSDAIRLVEMAMAIDPGVQNALLKRLLGDRGGPPPAN